MPLASLLAQPLGKVPEAHPVGWLDVKLLGPVTVKVILESRGEEVGSVRWREGKCIDQRQTLTNCRMYGLRLIL